MRIFFVLLGIVSSYVAASDNRINLAFSEGDPPTSYSNVASSYASQSSQALGILPELAALLFKFGGLRQYPITLKAYPWKRAKSFVKAGAADGLVTVPTGNNKTFMLFTEHPLYISDYGYIIYHKNNKNFQVIAKAASGEDLKRLTVVSDATAKQFSSSWEGKHLPPNIRKFFVNDANKLFHRVFNRKDGDFFIRNLEEARYISKKLGYSDVLAFKKVDFFSTNAILFHLGIRQDHKNAEMIIKIADDILRTPGYQKKAQEKISSYQQ